MTEKEQKKELEAVLGKLRKLSTGSGLEGLLRDSKLGLSRRTLQRRLSQLVKSGQVFTKGEGRGLMYVAASISIGKVKADQQYVALKQSLVSPDPFRMKYRLQLADAVCSIVRGGLAATEQNVPAVVPASVAKEDFGRFVELALTELRQMHMGNIVRYKIRLSEFEAWRRKTTEEGGNGLGGGVTYSRG